MKRLSLILIFIVSMFAANGTEVVRNVLLEGANANSVQVDMSDEATRPQFPGGDAELLKYIQDNIKYPLEAKNNGVQGRVIVQFVVKADGSIADAQVIKPVERSLDVEALRIVNGMPRWQPATLQGIPIDKRFTLPVTFRLDYGVGMQEKNGHAASEVSLPNNNVDKVVDCSSHKSVEINDHEAVDLGLSVKWAACNVGANSPEEYGGYYAWGETNEEDNYSWATYKWCNGSVNRMTKYRADSDAGIVDNKTTLDPKDDVARVKLGSGWRMPTEDEIKELRKKCTWEWTSVNGVAGYKVTGPNGNSIFLPAAGLRAGTDVSNRGSVGYYWSAMLNSDNSNLAYYLHFSSGNHDWDYRIEDSDRCRGFSVRPVTE